MHAERQRLGQAREHELHDDQAGDDPVKDLRHGRIARRLIWHPTPPRAQCTNSQSNKERISKLRKRFERRGARAASSPRAAPRRRAYPLNTPPPPRRRRPVAARSARNVPIASIRRTPSCASSCIAPESWPPWATIMSSSIARSRDGSASPASRTVAAFYLNSANFRFRGRRGCGARIRRVPISRRRSARTPKPARCTTCSSPAVLDAQEPSCDHRAERLDRAGDRAGGGMQATVRVTVAGHESSLVVPFTVETSADRLHAQATSRCSRPLSGSRPSASSGRAARRGSTACEARSRRHRGTRRSASSKIGVPSGADEHRRRPMRSSRGHGARRGDAGTRQAGQRLPRRRRCRTPGSGRRSCAGSYKPMSIESLVQETCGSAASGSSRPTNPSRSQYCLASSRSGTGRPISRKYPHSEPRGFLIGLNVRASIRRMRWPDGSSQPTSLNTSLPSLRYSKNDAAALQGVELVRARRA